MALDVYQFSLNGDHGSYFDGQTVVCTIDKADYIIRFSIMAQISKSDFGIFYAVEPLSAGTSSINDKHSGAVNRPPVYILPAVYLMPKKVENGSNNGGVPPPPPPPPSGGGGSGENGDDPKPIG